MYHPGPPAPYGPLSRYLPPLADGVAAEWLRQAGLAPGAWLIDPFGASPRLVVQAARAGYRVLTAANNPIARFLIELHADPPAADTLRTALAELSASQKAGERLEPHLRALYTTPCAACGQLVEAEAFIWEREPNSSTPRLAGRRYTCPACQTAGVYPATPYDLEQAARFANPSLHQARALERVAAIDDPDRGYVEEALNAYLPRAVYVLFTLVNQLDRLPAARLRGVSALLLAAFDQGNVLWPDPPGRLRPRQLSSPTRFYEKNLWRALEQAVDDWPVGLAASGPAVCVAWPEQPPESGGVCLFEGRMKNLDAGEEAPRIRAMLTALPRPNMAYWTLSALWAGWLWGRPAAAAFKPVLRRRRYDWAWHVEALFSAFESLGPRLAPNLPCLAFMGEAEAGFVSAALLAASTAGFSLHSLALRQREAQLQIEWRSPQAGAPLQPWPLSEQKLSSTLQLAVEAYLAQRGEPAPYLPIHIAAFEALLGAGCLPALTPAELVEAMQLIEKNLERILNASSRFVHYPPGTRLVESGLWGLLPAKDPAAPFKPPAALPLADRVEMEVVRALQKHTDLTLNELDERICAIFTGLFTPDLELISECAQSYSPPAETPVLQIGASDQPAARRRDLQEITALLRRLGEQLGFRVDAQEGENNRQVVWRSGENPAFIFYPIASAIISPALLHTPLPDGAQGVVVLPGSRAGLAAYKIRRDPRLPIALEAGRRLIKFRHLRRLAQDPTLTADSFATLLSSDPLDNEAGQLTMF